ncbi:MAG: glycosyltransferase [Bacteroidia bacterium]|nr:glycosyltransferase [Bacteroidia bacterium]
MQHQESEFVPYQAVKSVGNGKVLIFAPHPDDEVFGCGGAIIRHVLQNDPVKVVIVTDGAYPVLEEYVGGEYSAIRKNESQAAATILGYGIPDFLDYPDRGLLYGEKLIVHLLNIIQVYHPSLIYLPGVAEIHPDHRVLCAAATEASRRFEQDVILVYYEIGQALRPNKLLDITDIMDRKNMAIDCFTSQLKVQDYKYLINSLNAFRSYTLPKEVKSAEGFFTVDSKDVKSVKKQEYIHLIYQDARELQVSDEFDLPMVSVIVRSMNRAELPEALDSIAMQSYPNIEVIVVDALGKNELELSEWCGRFPMRTITKNIPLPRPNAANAGLDAIRGNFFCFLDEDDLIQPDHINNLVILLQDNIAPAAYSGIEKVNKDKQEGYVFNQPFDIHQLMWENFIPINAIVFKRLVLDTGCRFDEQFEVFEDWDFLIQVAQTGSFIHFNRITGIYRNYYTSGIHQDKDLNMKFKINVFDKWKYLLDPINYFEFLEFLHNLHFNEKIQLQNLLTQKDKEVVIQQETLNAIFQSRSWKLTSRLRMLAGSFRPRLKILRTNGLKPVLTDLYLYIQRRFSVINANDKKSIILGKGIADPMIRTKNIPLHNNVVDIIICIHNALEHVKNCLSSVIRYTHPPYNLILVDDGSEAETKKYLEEFSRSQGALLIRNESPLGYTKAANQGMKTSTALFLLLLNSDTVTGNIEWLDRLVFCAKQDARVGIISPLSNTASWQSVPDIFSGNDWADNTLPGDFSIEQMAGMVQEDSANSYPEIPFLNGFCLFIKKECLDSVGYFDETSFPEGYGEENDLCIRAGKMGWNLAVADDVYIYHAQSRSYSYEKRHRLSKEADAKLHKKHGSEIIAQGINKCQNNLILHGIRSRAAHYPDIFRTQKEIRTKFSGKKVLFVLPVATLCGGANVVIHEILALRSMHVDCYIANITEFRDLFHKAYQLQEIPVIYFDSPETLGKHIPYFDAIIGTAYSSIKWIKLALEVVKTEIIAGYYIQDFEPYFFPEGTPMRNQAWESYTLIPGIKCFTKTPWNKNEVYLRAGQISSIVSPSVNLDIFRPTQDKTFTGEIGITAMVRPETPRRSPELTMEMLKTIKKKYGSDVYIWTFGCDQAETIIRKYEKMFNFTHFGILPPSQLSALFNQTHIFIDMSSFQAMGLTGMEAMGCANAVILPLSGGAETFISHAQNGFLADTSEKTECLQFVDKLLNDRALLSEIAIQAVKDICQYSPIFSAKKIMDCLFTSPAK